MKSFGFIKAYSNNLGDAIGITSVQVRKDFSLFNISGNKKGGYNIDDLLEQIDSILGKQISHNIILVGYGKIGKALINYRGFESESIKIVAAFDHNPEKIDRNASTPILPIEELKDFIINNKIEIAILTVPDLEAQRMFDVICNAGIKGVLNFAPIKLLERPDCIINDVNIADEIESLFYFINDVKDTSSSSSKKNKEKS
ncbi:redox-sensing transcriptional repressor Rex [Brachyspira hyodysenteriae WA1]|nr:redox-sensing transcriptional repressor Rex [Brachyspira hyodysenteriae WA1]